MNSADRDKINQDYVLKIRNAQYLLDTRIVKYGKDTGVETKLLRI